MKYDSRFGFRMKMIRLPQEKRQMSPSVDGSFMFVGRMLTRLHMRRAANAMREPTSEWRGGVMPNMRQEPAPCVACRTNSMPTGCDAMCDSDRRLREAPSRSCCCADGPEVGVRYLPALMRFDTLYARGPPNGAHQPPTSCATNDKARVATTSPNHHWPDATAGKFTPPRDATQAPRYLERGAVDGRLHALVGQRNIKPPLFQMRLAVVQA